MQTIKVPTLNREAETVARHCEQRQLSTRLSSANPTALIRKLE